MTMTAPERTGSAVPRATRSRRPGWRNPRLLLGIVLVAGSVVLGARMMAAADDTVGVWAVPATCLPVRRRRGDVERRDVRFPDGGTADRYLAADDDLPDAATLNRPVSAGELLPRAAFARDSGPDLVEVPVSVVSDDLPATVRQGSVVDIWVAPKVSSVAGAKVKAVPVLTDVVVVAVPRSSAGWPRSRRDRSSSGCRRRAEELGTALGGIADGRVVVARKG